jgi:hypothetical protein
MRFDAMTGTPEEIAGQMILSGARIDELWTLARTFLERLGTSDEEIERIGRTLSSAFSARKQAAIVLEMVQRHPEVRDRLAAAWPSLPAVAPIPMRLHCPHCHALHLDVDEFATKPHHTHACQACGAVWRPAIVPTVGVRFLPGFKNAEPPR